MYALYKQTHPPSGVEHCVYCNFYSSKESNLVVVGTTHLRIYKLYLQTEKSSTDENVSDAPSTKKKLELVGQHNVFGNVETLQAVRLAGNSRDSILLSFKAAKLAIIEYDPTTHDIKTRSLHFFEDEKIKTNSILQDRPPIVRIDPERRCAVMLIYGTHLVVLPFRQEGGMDDHDHLDSGTSGSDRSPVLPSYIINTKELDEKTCNIVDLQFLHGYYEPTLLILYEPIKTWAGRLAMRRDTCALVAISLNMSEKVHPVIWQMGSLPFDSYSVLAVPKPISGVLVFTTNSLLYLNQSVPPYGVSLNSIAESSTSFPLKPQESVTICLENAHAIFISSDKFVVSLKGGEIYVVTLVADGIRSVRSFNFDKAAASVLTSCICECGDGYLFLGSRLGNSLLVKYTEKPQDLGDLFSPGVDPPNAKRCRMDSDFTYALDDIDEVEVYGQHEETGVELTSYTFEVCDSLLNIGPCTCLDMGEPGFLSEEFSESLDPDVELVTCSGYGKNGALTVLQRTVRPQVVTTFELPGCTDMWTVLSQNKEDQTPECAKHHSFLILSRQDSSMVLKTEQEIMELDNSGFTTQHPTIFAGNLVNGCYILQITPLGIRLLEGVKQVQHIPMDSGLSSIVWCSVADPYVILMTADGSVVFLEFNLDSNGPSLTVSRAPINQGSKVCACCTYKDVSGLLTTEKSSSTETNIPIPQHPPIQKRYKQLDVDEEDELLYGDSTTLFAPEPEKPSKPIKQGEPKVDLKEEPLAITYWCILCRQNGVLEIYSIPDFKLVFYVKNFNMAPKVLVDSKDPNQGTSNVSSVRDEESITVKEILLTGLGYKKRRVTLVAQVDQDLLIYEAFPFSDTAVEGHLNLRFKRVQHAVLVREKKTKSTKNKTAEGQVQTKVASLRVFDDVSSYAGIFVCGSFPHWIFVTNRGALRCHPMSIDGPVTCFAAFHNINCPKGFLYFNTKGELRISVLPTHLSYDSPWPVRKVPLRCTPHMAAYNRESKTYAIVTSEYEPCKHIPRVTPEDKEFIDTNRDSRFIYPMMDKFSIQLMSPLSWEIIPNTRHELEEWEHVTSMKNLMLHSQETHTGRKGFICLGTTMLYGEEFASRGRILIFDIIEVVPEPGQPLTKNKFKLLYDKEQKGPITALNQVNGYLVSGIGQKIYIWNFENNDLIGMAFIDTQLYIHSLVTIRNFVLAADLTKSITLLRLQEETKTLAFVSKDPHNLEVYGTDFFIDGTQIGFLVSDVDQNLILFTYQPEAIESAGGQRLLQRADINIGSHVTSFFRVRAKSVEKPGGEKTKDLRQLTYFGTLDGGLGFMLPMTEKTYRRLHMLQTKLVDCIPHVAGLNPKAFRMIECKRRCLSNPHRNVLDWELLSKFIHLGFLERQEVAKKIGTTPSQILDDMMDVERACDRF